MRFDGPAVDRAIDSVLSRPAFSGARKSWLTRLRDEVQSWVVEQLAKLFGSDAGSIVAWGLVALVAVVALLLLIRLVRTVRRTSTTATDGDITIHIERPPGAWLQMADEALRAGRAAEAVRCAYRAVVARLALGGAVEEVPGRTVGEYRAQVQQRRPDLLGPFGQASEVFERVWYAQRPAEQDDVRTVVGVAESLEGTS